MATRDLPLPGLGFLYERTDRGRAAFGDRYRPPAAFGHGAEHEVARYEPDADHDRLVVVLEARLPATFFTIAVTEADGSTWEMGTGSGQERLAADVAEAVWDGMLGLRR